MPGNSNVNSFPLTRDLDWGGLDDGFWLDIAATFSFLIDDVANQLIDDLGNFLQAQD